METWKGRVQQALAYLAFGILALLLLDILYQTWSQHLASRWWNTLGMVSLTALLVLGWRRLQLWSRPYLLVVYLIIIVGFCALYYGTDAQNAFAIGPLQLPFLVNLILFLSLSLSLIFILWGLKLSRNVKIAVGVLGLLGSLPFLIGMIKGISLPDVLRGVGFLSFLPRYLQPAFLAVVLLLPILILFLLRDLLRVLGDSERSTLRSAFSLLAAAVPLTLGLVTILGQTQQGLVTRYYNDHNFAAFQEQELQPTLVREWKKPPVKPVAGNRFWVEHEGLLQLPKAGEYEFQIEGQAKGFLFLDGKQVLGTSKPRGKIKMTAGRHPLRAALIADQESGNFNLQMKGPGEEKFHDIDPKAFSYQSEQEKWRRTPRQAAQVGIEWLQSASYAWQEQQQCFGCHVQGQVLMGLAVSKANDYRVNDEYYDALFEFTKTKQNKDGTYHSGHHVTATQFATLGLAAVQEQDNSKKNPNFIKSVEWLLSKQQENGEFTIDHIEAPIDQGSVMTTANAVASLMQAFQQTGDKKFQVGAQKALQYIEAAPAETTQDKIQKILALTTYGNAVQAKVAKGIVAQLKGEQQADGGWKEVEKMAGSNAYATGQVLYAFKKAGVSVNSAEFSKGVRFLLDNQKVTGAWPAQNTQTHRPSEFVPTMWAVIGLAGSFGEIIPEFVQPTDRASVEGKVKLVAQVTNFTESPISDVIFYLNDQELGKGTLKENQYELEWDTQGLKEGEHPLKVVAKNRAGKSGEASIVVFSGLGVKVKILAPVADAVIFDEVPIQAQALGLFGTQISGVEFFLEPLSGEASRQSLGIQKESAGENQYSLAWNTSELAEGRYRLTAVATNSRGQQAQDSVVVVKRQALTVKLTAPGASQSVSGLSECRAEVVNNTQSPISAVKFFLDGSQSLGRAAVEPWVVPCNFENVPLGAHELKVVAMLQDERQANDTIQIMVGEAKGPGYLKVQLKDLDQGGDQQVLYFPPDHIELVLDMSGSMWGQIQGVAKVEIARDVLNKLLAGFPPEASLGLRVYGHRSKKDCQDTELLVPFGKIDASAIQAKVTELKPKGMTPIDYSLRQVQEDLKGLSGSRVVILLTDGIESCDGDPVGAAQALMDAGLKVKIHVVGFDISASPEAVTQLQGVAKVGNGLLYLAEDAQGLTDALAEAVKVTYSVYDAHGKLVFTKPLGLESNELMNGVYRVEVALEPPLVLWVTIDKGQTSTVEVLREQKKFRIESPQRTAAPSQAETAESAPETQKSAETQP